MSTTQEKVFSLGEIGSVQYLLVLAQVGWALIFKTVKLRGFHILRGPICLLRRMLKMKRENLCPCPEHELVLISLHVKRLGRMF